MQKLNFGVCAITLALALILVGCNSNTVKISGRFIGGNSSVVYLEELSPNNSGIVDSAVMDSQGKFTFKFNASSEHHKLYNIVYDWSTIPLFVAPGDNIEISSVGNIARNYTIEGSEESELVRTFYQKFIAAMEHLDIMAADYGLDEHSDERRKAIAKDYTEVYTDIKRKQLEFIITNKSSLAAVYALKQRLPNDSYLFTGKSDVIYYRTVAEALELSYPDSPYRKSIQKDIDEFDAMNRLSENIVELNFPEIELPDMLGKVHKLSDLEGEVILLDFWSAQLGSSNRYNAELKELYEELQGQGFEVYQVAIDNSKSAWINAVQEQSLPWISVSDLKGNYSSVLTTYNITALPSNFVISRTGEIVARDTYGPELVRLIKAETAK